MQWYGKSLGLRLQFVWESYSNVMASRSRKWLNKLDKILLSDDIRRPVSVGSKKKECPYCTLIGLLMTRWWCHHQYTEVIAFECFDCTQVNVGHYTSNTNSKAKPNFAVVEEHKKWTAVSSIVPCSFFRWTTFLYSIFCLQYWVQKSSSPSLRMHPCFKS